MTHGALLSFGQYFRDPNDIWGIVYHGEHDIGELAHKVLGELVRYRKQAGQPRKLKPAVREELLQYCQRELKSPSTYESEGQLLCNWVAGLLENAHLHDFFEPTKV